MKKLVGVLAFAIFAAQCANSVSLRGRRDVKEEEKDTGVIALLGGGLNIAKSLPLIGSVVTFSTNWVSNTFNAMQDLTNGGFARVLGGTLPCSISIDTGLRCTGITGENNVASLVMEIVDQSPAPAFVKVIIQNVLKLTLDPAINVIFGGVATSRR